MSKEEQMVKWCFEDLKNIQRLFKGNTKVIQDQIDLTMYALAQLSESKKPRD